MEGAADIEGWRSSIDKSLEAGLIQTGFEIISGLPLEEQQGIHVQRLGNKFYALLNRGETGQYGICLIQLYRYNGEKWETNDD